MMYSRKTNKKDEVIKMGERTQMLIRLHDHTGEVKFSTILHYQWGYGRVMPMDALNLVIQMPDSFRLGLNNGVFSKGYLPAWFEWFGAKSKGVNYYEAADSKQLAYHATEDDLWESNNNDGFMIMDAYATGHWGVDTYFDRCALSFYSWIGGDIMPVDFNRYCKHSDSNDFTDGDFRRGYKCMLRTYGIELIEPGKEKE